jgi:hypothetical protein
MRSADLPEHAADLLEHTAEHLQNLYVCHSPYSLSITLFHAYRVSPKLHTGPAFYSVLLIITDDQPLYVSCRLAETI